MSMTRAGSKMYSTATNEMIINHSDNDDKNKISPFV